MTATGGPVPGLAAPRAWFGRDVLEVAPDLLGAYLTTVTAAGRVTLRITEVEAYSGEEDPASHAYRGPTARNAAMFGEPGSLYVYRHLGLHTCVNVVCGPVGSAAALLLRAGEVVDGVDLARARRTRAGVVGSDLAIARGPARLAVALDVDLTANGADVTAPPTSTRGVVVHQSRPAAAGRVAGRIATGPRVGVSGAGGDGARYPWRFWLEGDPTVSAYRRAYRRPARSGRLDPTSPGSVRRCGDEETHVSDVLDELHWRGLVAQSTDVEALRGALAGGPITLYCGFDPTAPSLHIGNLVQILTVRRLQLAGHLPLALVGGATGLIGDPKMVGERTLNPPEVVAEWVDRIRRQIEPLLDFSGPAAARMVNNLDWTAPMSAIDFLRDVGKHYRLGTMLAKDTVARRLTSEQGISFTEFSYQILQGMDYLELFRRHGATLQTGGNDQWGNLLSGVELIHKAEHVGVHALTTPLITKADGTKFGKTESGTVWLDPELTSPYAFYQFWLNTNDSDVAGYLKVFTFRSRAEITEFERAVAERPAARQAQRALASDVTLLVHGETAVGKVVAASQALFGRGDLRELDELTTAAAVAELPTAAGGVGDLLVDLLAATGVVASKTAARRAVAEGGAAVNNIKITDETATLSSVDLLHGRWAVLRRGRRTLAVVDARAAGPGAGSAGEVGGQVTAI